MKLEIQLSYPTKLRFWPYVAYNSVIFYLFIKKERMGIYEIHDCNGVIMSGDPVRIMHAWNQNYLNDDAFETIYGHRNRDEKLIIREWEGDLKIIVVLDKHIFGPGKHQTWFKESISDK